MLTNAMEVRGFCCRLTVERTLLMSASVWRLKKRKMLSLQSRRCIEESHCKIYKHAVYLGFYFFFPLRRVFPAVLQLEKKLMDFTEKLQHL